MNLPNKVICIKSITMPSLTIKRFYFTEGKIYEIRQIDKLDKLKYVIYDDYFNEWYYLGIKKYFISLSELRKQKLDKLKSL